MKRNLETLSLALVAALGLSAVMASAASAAPKLTSANGEYPVTLKGEQTKTLVLEFEGGRKTECAVATFEGEAKNKAEAEESKLTIQPAYSNCSTTILGNKDPTTITMNGCDWLITATETTSGTIAAEGWEVTSKDLHILCPIEHVIEAHVYGSMANHEADVPLCTFHTAPQTPGGDQDSKGTEKNAEGAATSTAIAVTITSIKVTKTSGTVTNCGGASQTSSITGEIKVEGFNSNSEMLRGKVDME